jgi:hypothetical protein
MFVKPILAAAALSAVVVSAAPASAAIPIYPNPGSQNNVLYTFTAATSGNVLAYFAGVAGGFTQVLGLRINGVDSGINGLNNQMTAPGTSLDFGPVTAGDLLTFYITDPDSGISIFSDRSLNFGNVNHVWSTGFSDGDFGIPNGQFIVFEDLVGGGDFNYADHGFVVSNIETLATAVPEPASWAMMIAGFGAVGLGMRRRAKVTVSYA